MLIEEIRLHETHLQCMVQVVHVPGDLMITQGTDGLSRGIWISPLRTELTVSSSELNSSIFAPLSPDPDLVDRTLITYLQWEPWRLQPHDSMWLGHMCLHRLNVWFPPPELARRAITFALETWVESPYTTAHLFFVPRTLAGSWHGLSRHIVELTTLHNSDLPEARLVPIPTVVLYLPRFTPSLAHSHHRMDTTPYHIQRAHRAQADAMRGLSPEPIPGNP